VREVGFGSTYLDSQEDRDRFIGHNFMLDIMILREPTVALPRRATLGPANGDMPPSPRSSLGRQTKFAIISEQNVGSTQERGLEYGLVLRDIHKLDGLVRAAMLHYRNKPLPTPCMCILDNNPRQTKMLTNRPLPRTARTRQKALAV
jgi:hypothetical protein